MPNPPRISRRGLLKLGAASVAGLSLVDARTQGRPLRQDPGPSSGPKNIIFMVTDGMSTGVPAMAEAFSQLPAIRGHKTNWVSLSKHPDVRHGQFDMASLDSLVTDSAAAASAWASGSRIFNWAVNMLPDGVRLTPIGVLAKQSGRAVGLVTTTRITHATPACFAAAVPQRDKELEVGPQYLDVVDVALGGGMKHFDPAQRADKRDLLGEFSSKKYKVVKSRDDLMGAAPPSNKVIGIFDNNHLPYTIDRNRDPATQKQCPTLVEMTNFALKSLSLHANGFFLMIEGGRVDHAAHNCDPAGMLWDQLAFDDAIGTVFEFQQQHPETLVIITSDHGCGGPNLIGLGPHYELSTQHFQKLALASASFDSMEARLKEAMTSNARVPRINDIQEVIHWGTGLEITQGEGTLIADAIAGKLDLPEINRLEANVYGIVAQILGNQNGIAWTGISHTAEWVPILAFGPGSDEFKGLLKNTDAYERMTRMWGIAHHNPSMTPDEAAKFAATP
jgi:alkaline phosphatase